MDDVAAAGNAQLHYMDRVETLNREYLGAMLFYGDSPIGDLDVDKCIDLLLRATGSEQQSQYDYPPDSRCESGWTGDRCTLPLFHSGPHSNE